MSASENCPAKKSRPARCLSTISSTGPIASLAFPSFSSSVAFPKSGLNSAS
jgi:hypothetical protein